MSDDPRSSPEWRRLHQENHGIVEEHHIERLVKTLAEETQQIINLRARRIVCRPMGDDIHHHQHVAHRGDFVNSVDSFNNEKRSFVTSYISSISDNIDVRGILRLAHALGSFKCRAKYYRQ